MLGGDFIFLPLKFSTMKILIKFIHIIIILNISLSLSAQLDTLYIEDFTDQEYPLWELSEIPTEKIPTSGDGLIFESNRGNSFDTLTSPTLNLNIYEDLLLVTNDTFQVSTFDKLTLSISEDGGDSYNINFNLKSIESDILNDGSLDYDVGILKTFDLVIASIHSNLKMDEAKAMQRIITAIENPYTNILGHMTGRLLLAREGYPLDHHKVIDACIANKVIIELNASPHRLDIDWRLIPYALEKGAMISINPDAHSVEGIHDIYYGVCAARKGHVTAAETLNAAGPDEFLRLINKK